MWWNAGFGFFVLGVFAMGRGIEAGSSGRPPAVGDGYVRVLGRRGRTGVGFRDKVVSCWRPVCDFRGGEGRGGEGCDVGGGVRRVKGSDIRGGVDLR